MASLRALSVLRAGFSTRVQRTFIHKFVSVVETPASRRCNPAVCQNFRVSMTAPTTWCLRREYAKKSKKEKGKGKVYLSLDQVDEVINLAAMKSEMTGVLEQLKLDYINQLSLRVSTHTFDTIVVEIDNNKFPLNQIAQIIQKNPSLILINLSASPQYLPAAKDAIIKSGTAINPQVEGTTIFIPIPKVSKEHREKLSKSAKTLCDKSKLKLRDVSNKYTKKLKAAKQNHSEDLIRNIQELLQYTMLEKMTDAEQMMARKQKDLTGGK